jgi:hypothetical protein
MTNPPPGSGPPPGVDPASAPTEPRRGFQATLVRVMIVQVVTLVLLWLLQARFHVGG